MIPLKKIAAHINGHLIGDENVMLRGIASIKDAKEGEVTFLTHAGFRKYLKECKASAIIVGKDFPVDTLQKIGIIVTDDPVSAYIKTIELFTKPRKRKAGRVLKKFPSPSRNWPFRETNSPVRLWAF